MPNKATCFYRLGNSINSDQDGTVPCRTPRSNDDVVNCCFPGDECLTDNICHFTHPPTTGGAGNHQNTGYYTAGCTDATYSDSACTSHCTSYSARDITYNVSSNIWACCVNDPNSSQWSCLNPGNETWQGTPQQSLSTLAALPSDHNLPPSIVATSYIAEATSGSPTFSTSVASSTETALQSSGPLSAFTENGLSSGAKAGIGVGVALGVSALVGLIAFLVWRRRRRRRRPGSTGQNSSTKDDSRDPPAYPQDSKDAGRTHGELDSVCFHEMSQEQTPQARNDVQYHELNAS